MMWLILPSCLGLAPRVCDEVVWRPRYDRPYRPSVELSAEATVDAVLGAFRDLHAPYEWSGLDIAFDFAERHPSDDSLRSSWVLGANRGRCGFEARGLPFPDSPLPDGDRLFVTRGEHASEIEDNYGDLMYHLRHVVGYPRWGADDLVEFDFLVDTDEHATCGPAKLRGRVLLHRPEATWYVRGLSLLGCIDDV